VLHALPVFYHFRATYAVWHDKKAVLMATLFEPFALWLAVHEAPSLEELPLVSVSKGRVVHASKTAKQLGVTPGLSLATALTKAPDLADSHAQPLGIEALSIELSGLTRLAKQGTLWPRKERLEEAVAAVEARFPRAILKLVEDDPYALASEHSVRFVVRSSGEEVSRAPEADAPGGPDRRERQPLEA
jgi:nucleotidyltransferase/DNA polymerase involved in DNA repair